MYIIRKDDVHYLAKPQKNKQKESIRIWAGVGQACTSDTEIVVCGFGGFAPVSAEEKSLNALDTAGEVKVIAVWRHLQFLSVEKKQCLDSLYMVSSQGDPFNLGGYVPKELLSDCNLWSMKPRGSLPLQKVEVI